MLRWGLFFIAAAVTAFGAFMLHEHKLDHDWTLLDEPLQVVAGRMVTETFTVPAKTTYDMKIYVETKVRYADCLLGQGGYLEERCTRHRGVIDVTWTLHASDGRVLRKGVSGGTCCDYTTDEHSVPVASTMLDTFTLPNKEAAYLKLNSNRDITQLASFNPRVVVERTPEDSESEAVAEVFSYAGITLAAAIGVVLCALAVLRSRASRLKGGVVKS